MKTAAQFALWALALASPSAASPFRNQRREGAANAPVTVTYTIPAATSTASADAVYDWTAGATPDFVLHSSCNATQKAQLRRGFKDAVDLAAHARDHILRFGNSSEFYTRYFGNAPTAEPIGWYSKVATGDHTGQLFRCDDPDDNCKQDGWAGHWRGENATAETVICPLSFESRKSLEGLCGFGWDVASGSLSLFFGGDLIHRLFHLPSMGEDVVDHIADDYADCLELAKTSPAEAVRNTHTLQYFAYDVYAYDISLPGEGCPGKADEESAAAEAAPASSSASAAAASSAPTTTTPSEATTTTTGGTECHTHADGVTHCS